MSGNINEEETQERDLLNGFLHCQVSIFELSEHDSRQLIKEALSVAKKHFDRSAPSDSGIPCRRCLISTRIGNTITSSKKYITKCLKTQEDDFMNNAAKIKKQKKNKKKNEFNDAKLPFTNLLSKLARAVSIIDKGHPKCLGCGLLFGGYHIAYPTTIAGIGEVCQWCWEDYRKYGRAVFLKRLHQVRKMNKIMS